ncbi:hypothetical protein CSE45_3123 [Citreicella sp. SE45]|uniref:DUF58 domain-containing protein n=1 Tax=Salipiger thiooxidans TaxID=282683 RepID=A0A1G7E2Q6_9RHOB|nr:MULTISPECIES: DUF58 domain-containing protein [Salipiger]EEX13407.1 hypothetical protein CSE45_3123 [Citreicella sp. SE45]MAU47716.1 DUF58 domain-containing protein [Salipiger sp.]NIY96215.1 DUF58 domain-containing protein [Salipiger sp. HF18]SDE57994.1 Protein of unknown function DUF58 [Salipiger thiooxidans]
MSDRITLLRRDAQEEASRFPALLARAEHLAGTVLLGDHGRRRSGVGDDFWQYRPLRAGDSVRSIDWRRSARGDDQYVREREWQIAQSVLLWVDTGASMRFSSGKDLPSKGDRARLVALAAAVLLIRGGERVGFTGWSLPPRGGDVQILRLAEALATDGAEDYSEPEARGMIPHARAVFVSDFLGNLDPVEAALTKAADRGVRGVLVQVLDPTEETFPFKGRTIFESVGGSVSHETLKAGDLRTRYLERLAERKARLAHLSRLTGWQYLCHHTSDSAQNALLWLYRAMDGGHG